MGVGFHLTANYPITEAGPSAEDWLQQVAAWLEADEAEPLVVCRPARCAHGESALFVQVHPCAEEIELCVPEPGRLIASAKTSTVGPGYHIYLCERLHELSRHFGLTWDEPDQAEGTGDETGYFFAGDQSAVRQEMLRWLGALAHVVTDEQFAEQQHVRMVSMPLGYTYPEQHGVLTPLGPRSREWFRVVADQPERGMEFFSWWETGVGSGFYLGRALCRLWQDVRWRPPLTDAEGELLMDVHLDLERAFRLDESASIPWREWSELIEYLDEYFGYVEFHGDRDLDREIRTRAQRAMGGPRIGYRRGPVQVSLTGGWSITVPGELAEKWEPEQEAWSAWHGGRAVRFACWVVRDEDDDPQPACAILRSLEMPDGEMFEHRAGPVRGRACFYRSQDCDRWALKAYSAVDGGFAECDVLVKDRDDLPWALEVWQTLRH
jgi:hypothetical protein